MWPLIPCAAWLVYELARALVWEVRFRQGKY
jgi:hypothetical protein